MKVLGVPEEEQRECLLKTLRIASEVQKKAEEKGG